jgi:hypothetical protein
MTSQTQGCKNNLPAHIAFSQSIEADIVYNLSDSTAQTMTVSELCALGNNNIDELSLSYGALMGDDALRQAIATFHQDLNTPKKVTAIPTIGREFAREFFSCVSCFKRA